MGKDTDVALNLYTDSMISATSCTRMLRRKYSSSMMFFLASHSSALDGTDARSPSDESVLLARMAPAACTVLVGSVGQSSRLAAWTGSTRDAIVAKPARWKGPASDMSSSTCRRYCLAATLGSAAPRARTKTVRMSLLPALAIYRGSLGGLRRGCGASVRCRFLCHSHEPRGVVWRDYPVYVVPERGDLPARFVTSLQDAKSLGSMELTLERLRLYFKASFKCVSGQSSFATAAA